MVRFDCKLTGKQGRHCFPSSLSLSFGTSGNKVCLIQTYGCLGWCCPIELQILGIECYKGLKMKGTYRNTTNDSPWTQLAEMQHNRSDSCSKAEPPDMSMCACAIGWTLNEWASSFAHIGLCVPANKFGHGAQPARFPVLWNVELAALNQSAWRVCSEGKCAKLHSSEQFSSILSLALKIKALPCTILCLNILKMEGWAQMHLRRSIKVHNYVKTHFILQDHKGNLQGLQFCRKRPWLLSLPCIIYW